MAGKSARKTSPSREQARGGDPRTEREKTIIPRTGAWIEEHWPRLSARIPPHAVPFLSRCTAGFCTHPELVDRTWVHSQGGRVFHRAKGVPVGFFWCGLQDGGGSEYLFAMSRSEQGRFWFYHQYIVFFAVNGPTPATTRESLYDALDRWDAGQSVVIYSGPWGWFAPEVGEFVPPSVKLLPFLGIARCFMPPADWQSDDEPPLLSRNPVTVLDPRADPSYPTYRVTFLVEREDEYELDIITRAGCAVRHLHRGPLPEGPAAIRWDGHDEGGRRVPAGTYVTWLRQMGYRPLTGRVVVEEHPPRLITGGTRG